MASVAGNWKISRFRVAEIFPVVVFVVVIGIVESPH